MGAIETTIDAITDNRTYYNCPQCGKRVWAYGSYVGNTCWKCPGTIAHGTVNTVFKAVHPGGAILTPLEKHHSQKDATYGSSKRVFYTSYGYQCSDNISDSDKSDYIKYAKVRSCRILHGSVSWLATAVKNTASLGQLDAIEHWWVKIYTNNGKYYVLQFVGRSNMIELRKCNSSYECDQCGLREAGKKENADMWDENDYSYTYSNDSYTIGDVTKWLKSHEFSSSYCLISHNCQDLCKAFYKKF